MDEHTEKKNNERILKMLSLLCDFFWKHTHTQPNTHIPSLRLTLFQLVPCFSVEGFHG